MTLIYGHGHDTDTALAGGFDIVESGYWVRPDNASIRRMARTRATANAYVRFDPPYRAVRADGRWSRFYTMTEAVEWIGGTR